MCWWILRKSTTALRRRFEPFLRRATRRWARRSFFCAWRYSLGFSISASSDRVAKEDKPRSMPTAALVSGSVTDKNFAAILRAEHDVVRQVEDGSGVLDVTTVFSRLKSYVIRLPCSYLFFKYLHALTCRLKSAVRRAVTYRTDSALNAPLLRNTNAVLKHGAT